MSINGLRRSGWLMFSMLFSVLALVACEPLTTPSSSSTSDDVPSATPVATSSTANDPVVVVEEAAASPTPEPSLAALVNGQPVYLADYERELERYEASLEAQGIDPNSPEGQQNVAQQSEWILNVMIEQELTEQAAVDAGITVSDEEVDTYMKQTIEEIGGEEELEAKLAAWGETKEDAWREVRAQLIGMKMTQRIVDSVPTQTEHVHARHILVDTREEAERILAQLQASADFTALAEAHSQDTSTRENGGDLGFFPRGILVAPEVEEVAFALQPGQFSGVIESPLGYHIVQVVERDPARTISPDNLRLLREQAVQKWIEELWAQAEVQYFIETGP